MEVYRFQLAVNCSLMNNELNSDFQQDAEELYEDNGFIILPEQYSKTGVPTRLVVNCHGAGGAVTTDDSQVEHQVLTQYLVANGYAVMDVNGLPQAYAKKYGIDIRNNIGSPIAIRSYVKAYHYCMEHFNLKPGVFVHGASMGGISSTNLVLSGCIPVIAHSAFCPVLDTYNEIFQHPWSGGLPKHAMGKIYGFKISDDDEYIYDESKLSGYNPTRNTKSICYPVPVKFWHCQDDPTVSYQITKEFVERIKEHGGIASLRSFSHGGHEPQLVGDPIANPCGSTTYGEVELQIYPAVEEAFIWIRNFD
jgi:hypothetical protein